MGTAHRPDPRDPRALSRHRDHGDLGNEESVISRSPSAPPAICSRTRFRPSPPPSATRGRAFTDLGLDRAFHRAPDPEQSGAAAGPPLNTAKLTPRDIDILWGIAKGFSYARSRVISGYRARPDRAHQEYLSQAGGSYPWAKPCFRGGAARPDPPVNEDAAESRSLRRGAPATANLPPVRLFFAAAGADRGRLCSCSASRSPCKIMP